MQAALTRVLWSQEKRASVPKVWETWYHHLLTMWAPAKFLHHVQLFETLWTVALRALLSMEFSRPEYWSEAVPFSRGSSHEPRSPALRQILYQLSYQDWGVDFDYCDAELFALERNQDHFVISEVAPKYCILDSCWLVRATLFPKGFLPTVVDITVI